MNKDYDFLKVLGAMTTDDQVKLAKAGWTFAGKVRIDGHTTWTWRRPKRG